MLYLKRLTTCSWSESATRHPLKGQEGLSFLATPLHVVTPNRLCCCLLQQRSLVGRTSWLAVVALRLHWDRDLADADARVLALGPGEVELRGIVADLN